MINERIIYLRRKAGSINELIWLRRSRLWKSEEIQQLFSLPRYYLHPLRAYPFLGSYSLLFNLQSSYSLHAFSWYVNFHELLLYYFVFVFICKICIFVVYEFDFSGMFSNFGKLWVVLRSWYNVSFLALIEEYLEIFCIWGGIKMVVEGGVLIKAHWAAWLPREALKNVVMGNGFLGLFCSVRWHQEVLEELGVYYKS